MTEIFDAERARRSAILRQQSAPNVIKINPDTASFLRRYEDADVSRLKLLEAQRLRNESEEQTKLIKSQQKRLKKRFRSGKGLGRAPRGRQPRQPRAPAAPEKSALEVEIEREKQIAAIAAQKKKEEVEEERFTAERLDARLERRRLDRSTIFQSKQEATRLQLEDWRQQREFVLGQNQIAANQQIAIYNATQAELRTRAINDSRTAQAIANRGEQGRIEDQRAGIRGREIDADIARITAERAGVAERVARDDAFRHAQLQEQQRLAIENLAQQQLDNTARHELERNRIDNQRAVDAERAITDRELIQGFTSAIEFLNAQRDQDPPRIMPSAQELANTVRERLRSSVGAGLQPQPQADRPQRGSAPTESTSSASSDLGTEAEEVIQIQAVPGDATPRQTVAERRAERRANRSPSTRRSPARGTSAAATARQPLTLEEQSGSSVSSSEGGLDPDIQRTLSIMSGRGAPLGRQRERQEQIGLTPTGRLGERSGLPVLGKRSVVRGRATSPTIGSEAQDSPLQVARGQVETIAEDSTLQQVGEALGGAVTGLARGAGGLVAGVAQGIGRQLPSASDVGAAVGRAGVSAVAGIGGAIYEGIAGGEQADEPIDRQGTTGD